MADVEEGLASSQTEYGRSMTRRIFKIPLLDAYFIKDPSGQIVFRKLEMPQDMEIQTWNKLGFEGKRSELMLRKVLPLVGKVPIAQLEKMIDDEFGPLPSDFSVPSGV